MLSCDECDVGLGCVSTFLQTIKDLSKKLYSQTSKFQVQKLSTYSAYAVFLLDSLVSQLWRKIFITFSLLINVWSHDPCVLLRASLLQKVSHKKATIVNNILA